jgi:DNA invertase Pin-like site-specific DNA recombinase
MSKRVAIYTRVSTDRQTTENQLAALREWAARAGHTVVALYEDRGISGAKGRDKRPQFDAMLKAAVRRDFDIVAVWSTDRLARSLIDLIEALQTIRASKAALFIHSQGLDTSTPAGRMVYQVLGSIAEFERELIIARVNAGLARARAQGKRLGRPSLSTRKCDAIRTALRSGSSVRDAVRATGASVGSVAAVRKELLAEGALAT